MPVVYLVLFIASALCFLFAALGTPQPKIGLAALGAFLFVAVFVIKAALGLPG
jgi:hypothetical protein